MGTRKRKIMGRITRKKTTISVTTLAFKSQRPRKTAIDSADSDFSADEAGFKSSKRKTKKLVTNNEDKVDSNEDTFEEEDPFSPEVDLICADKIVEENLA